MKKSELKPSKLKNFKNLLIAGLILVAVIVFSLSEKQVVKKAEEKPETAESHIEERLEEILSKVKGAGKVEVMVVFKDNGRENIAMNVKKSQDGEGEFQSEETAVMGSDDKAVVIQKNIPEVQGVIVTAQGADNPQVREDLKRAVEAALPVLPHRIEVLPGE